MEIKVVATLRKIVADKHAVAQTRATEVFERTKTNSYTTNSHYLTESADATKVSASILFSYMGGPYSADMKPYFNVVSNIAGFLKTRKKLVPDVIQLSTMRILDALINETKTAIRATMVEENSLDLIKEPASVVRKRKLNLDREKQIEKVFNEIRAL